MEKRSTYVKGFIVCVLLELIIVGFYLKTGTYLGLTSGKPSMVMLPIVAVICLYKIIYPGNPKDKE